MEETASGSRNHDQCIRIPLLHAPDILPGLAIRDIRHRTGIDHTDIRLFSFSSDLKTGVVKLLPEALGFVLIYFAAQCIKHYLHKLLIPNRGGNGAPVIFVTDFQYTESCLPESRYYLLFFLCNDSGGYKYAVFVQTGRHPFTD